MASKSSGCYGLLMIAAMFLGGCASGATAEGMTVKAADIKGPASPTVSNAVAVGAVDGGEKTDPMWMSQIDNPTFKKALVRSLHKAGLLSDAAHPKYVVSVQLIALKQPYFGMDMKVTSVIRYRLTDAATGALVLDEEIFTPYTAKFGDSLIGVERLRLANEGSARKSIATLIEKLNAAPKSTGKSAPPAAAPATPLTIAATYSL
jgi:hypothetical protein